MVLDLATGREVWRTDRRALGADRHRLYVSKDEKAGVHALDWSTGDVLWGASESADRLLSDGQTVVCGTPATRFAARSAATGQLLWRIPSGLLPVALGDGRVFCYDHRGVEDAYLVTLGLKDGAKVGERSYLPAGAYGDVLSATWLSEHGLLLLLGGKFGAGVNNFLLQAYTRDPAGPVWKRDDVCGGFVSVGGVLVCDAFRPEPEAPVTGSHYGVVGLAPETGRVLWRHRRPGQTSSWEGVAGSWRGEAVIVEPRRYEDTRRARLLGLRPRDGAVIWTLAVPPASHVQRGYEAGSDGEWLVVVCESERGQPVSVEGYQ